jgi:type IV pilus assembly protein PilY1
MLFDASNDCIQDAGACGGSTQAAAAAALDSARGWFITLGPGEKVVGSAISAAGTTFFNTNQPSAAASADTCGANLGVARQYQVSSVDATATSNLNYATAMGASSRSMVVKGGGFMPAPVHVVVQLGGKTVEAIISGPHISPVSGTPLASRLRKYWYKEVD